MALRARPYSLRRIADKLLDKGEQGDLAAAREVIDRTDGRAVQSVEYGDAPAMELTDSQLYEIAGRGLAERDHLVLKALPPPRGKA
jgi:ribosomal protein L17